MELVRTLTNPIATLLQYVGGGTQAPKDPVDDGEQMETDEARLRAQFEAVQDLRVWRQARLTPPVPENCPSEPRLRAQLLTYDEEDHVSTCASCQLKVKTIRFRRLKLLVHRASHEWQSYKDSSSYLGVWLLSRAFVVSVVAGCVCYFMLRNTREVLRKTREEVQVQSDRLIVIDQFAKERNDLAQVVMTLRGEIGDLAKLQATVNRTQHEIAVLRKRNEEMRKVIGTLTDNTTEVLRETELRALYSSQTGRGHGPQRSHTKRDKLQYSTSANSLTGKAQTRSPWSRD